LAGGRGVGRLCALASETSNNGSRRTAGGNRANSFLFTVIKQDLSDENDEAVILT